MNEPLSAERVVFLKWSPASVPSRPYALESETSHVNVVALHPRTRRINLDCRGHKYEPRSKHVSLSMPSFAILK